jgi:signal transduction histidine kinase
MEAKEKTSTQVVGFLPDPDKEFIYRQQRVLVTLATSPEVAEGEVEELCRLATELAARTMRVARVSVWLLDESRAYLRQVDLFQRELGLHESGAELRSRDYPDYFDAMKSGRLVAADDAMRDPRTREFAAGYLEPLGISSMLDAALRVSGEVVGVLCFEQTGRLRKWTPSEQSFAAEVAGQISHCLLSRSRRESQAREQALREQLLRSQKQEALGRLAGGVAHDFNNLLTAISGLALQLEASLPEGESKRDAAGILEAARRGADLTKQLLNFARNERTELSRIDARESVVRLERMLSRVLRSGVSLSLRVPRAPLFIDATEGLLQQVATNLVINAQDAIANRGVVRIVLEETRVGQEVEVEEGRLCVGRYVRLSVRDDGCGMTEEVRHKVFHPFFTTKAEGKGTGLGLSTVLAIVDRCHGALSLVTAPGAGCEVSVYFPLPQDREGLSSGSATP